MKPYPRIRKTVKWGGAAVTVLLLVVWIGSAWWMAALVTSSGFVLDLSQGEWTFGRVVPPGGVDPLLGGFNLEPTGIPLESLWASFRWWVSWTSTGQGDWSSSIPGWIP